MKGGAFSHVLGAKTPLTAALLTGERWLQVQVATDAPLPTVPVRGVLFALRAAAAEGLECSGCIKAGHLDPALLQGYAKTSDLSAYAKSADLSGYAKTSDLADYVKAAALATVAGTGDYKDLKNLPTYATVAKSGSYLDLVDVPAMAKVNSSCGTGLVVKGIKADGSLDCVAGGLPADGLNEVSNGQLSTEFAEIAPSTATPLAIADNLPAGVSDAITVPDFGVAQSLTVSIDLANSDIAKVRVTLYDPAGTAYKLYDQGGTGTKLVATYPTPDKLVAGDLGAWTGKNPKGTWSINVADLAAAAGNPKNDGALNSWTITVNTLSSKKVAVSGALVMTPASAAPVPCQPSTMGAIYFDKTVKTLRYCDGAVWKTLADSCGNGILDVNEECDDGNNANGDGCSSTCIAALGLAKTKPGTSCLDILKAWASDGTTAKDGIYWVKAPKGQIFQAFCDMTTDGGGYTYLPVDSGKTTFKSTDDNTCKDYGWDIVYPRTKSQWISMLGKYGTSYFATIPGVTKPGDGGNYTGCVMRDPKAYGSGCGDWKVPDGGKWWLRDSTYSEPNGDYGANCWLSMYNFDPNNIQFNDGTCGYSTSKYLCAPNDKP
ncbi:MAG: proprotein convertase P-domain-containing protein [Deltaproteobacteria bacterium]|nr:proprotein convertase P-domain-containing protein [Deltaproteobacteria bacterium]